MEDQMEDMDSYHLQTAFFSGSAGSIHLSLFLPVAERPSRWIIHFPAFAEEMNKSRFMVARTARALARSGVAVVVPDLFGTGDSEGHFVDATWAIWLEDQQRLVTWVQEQGGTELLFWGLRAGCLLAAELASSMPVPPEQLIFWQPVSSGKQLMAQFLRLHRVASMAAAPSAGSSQGREARREDGELPVVAGYQLARELFQTIESRHLSDFPFDPGTLLSVFEIVARPEMPDNRVIQSQLEQWRQSGVACRFSRICGAPFWSTQEVGLAPALTDEMVTTFGLRRTADHISFVPKGLGKTAQCISSLSFCCDASRLVGILHSPVETAGDTAVVIVVGGPQYRVGSHRQFVLLARALQEEGYPVLRFDYRGMGDSEGDYCGFEGIDQDIRSAIDALQAAVPSVRRVVLWGLCDGATASVRYAHSDERVHGLVLANPWVFSEKGSAKAYLKHYYLKRFLSREFWSKLFSGRLKPRHSLRSLVRFAKATLAGNPRSSGSQNPDLQGGGDAADARPSGDLAAAFGRGLTAFSGSVLLIVSGEDLTAAEFTEAARSCSPLKRAIATQAVEKIRLVGADHTFSRPEWRQEVEKSTLRFLRTL